MGKIISFRTLSEPNDQSFEGVKTLIKMGMFIDSLELVPGYTSITEVIRKHGFANCTKDELIKTALRIDPQTWKNKVFLIKALVDEWRLRR